jgi:KinB signaling pathway activation protein
MRLHQFIFLVASTVLIGALAGLATSLTGLWMHLPWYAGMVSGAFFSTTSLMGFWAYLTLNFIARITLPRRVWRWAQVLVLALVIYDMLWGRYHLNSTVHADQHVDYWTYFVQGFWPLVVGLVGASLKRRQSGQGSFLPALFFLYVFTVIDSLPFIWLQYGWSQSGPLVNQILIVMMACNLYITLIYGKLLNSPGVSVPGPTTNKPSL